MPVRGVTVLLVGDGSRNAPILENHLRKRGCNISFASSKNEAMELLQHHQFDLILSEFMLSDGTALQFMSPLLGTKTTMFVSNAVEDGCWWMTAVFQGQDRTHEPGMRPREFRIRLDEVLYDQFFRAPTNSAGALADRPKNASPPFGDRTTVSVRDLEPRARSHPTSSANGYAES
jgi:response regulator RpfG family c-di-GMP phosphodiesterase